MSHIKKEWFTAFELESCEGLPAKATNITRKATKENWKKRQIKGKKGVAFEYHYSSLPAEVQQALGFSPVSSIESAVDFQRDFMEGGDEVVVSKRRLLSSIETLDKILDLTHREMRPKEKAEMTWMIYELLNEDSANDNILNIMKLIA